MANTGNVIVTERDVNPDSSTYNTTRTRKYQDFQRCAPDTGNFKAVTFASDNTPTIVQCGNLNTTHLTRREVNDRTCVSAVIGDCTTKTSAISWPYENSGLVGTFEGCSNLENVFISDTVTEIGTYTFRYCRNLHDVQFGGYVTIIGNGAFYECTGLTDIIIPDSVTSIVDYAFYACMNLSNIVIGNSVTAIGSWAFAGCASLDSVTLPASIEDIYEYAFNGNVATTHSITCLGTTPPYLRENGFGPASGLTIYVPANSVQAYKSATAGWRSYVGCIQPIPEP